MTATEHSFSASDGTTLAGTLLLPAGAGPHPAVLLIVGSGEVDRDSDHRKLRLGITRALAEALAAAGIASLRYDKRGVGSSGGEYLTTTFSQAREDAAAALASLHRHPAVDGGRVLVLGHSEGAMHATSLAADTPGLAGAMLLSGIAGTGEVTMRWQARAILPTLPAPVRGLLRLLRQSPDKAQAKLFSRVRGTDADVIRVQGAKLNAGWLRGFLDHDVAPELARLSVPVLALTGERDLQVNPDDLDRMAELARSAPIEIHRIEGVNHILRATEGNGAPSDYRRQAAAEVPLDPRVLEVVTTWATARVAVPA